jgi:hypothetical protein
MSIDTIEQIDIQRAVTTAAHALHARVERVT